MPVVDRRPTGALRWFLRAPIWLYRARLGALLGRRFLYLAHRGRTTGLRREVVLEVVGIDKARREAYVVAAWGRRSDWLRNIEAAPAIEVRLGRRSWSEPQHRLLDAAETAALLRDYGRRHPRAWRALAPRLGLTADLAPDTVAEAVSRFPAVAFSPRAGR